ncbi:MAG: multicopper oxidase domain-containing protein, partial [Proteobacteria bacterium]|nr:multicopper oxidase domain-containing protein [Pseudomonadota bacterium]
MITRRKALKALGISSLGASTGLLMPSLATAQAVSDQGNLLKIPQLAEGELSGNVRQFQLRLQRGSSNFFADTATATFGINGDYLGPTLRFRRNEAVSLHIQNGLGEPTTLHWHGFHLPTSADGGPHEVIAIGDSWNPQFTVVQFAGTFWYHSHMLNTAGEQVYKGLAGMIIVEDDEQQIELPS